MVLPLFLLTAFLTAVSGSTLPNLGAVTPNAVNNPRSLNSVISVCKTCRSVGPLTVPGACPHGPDSCDVYCDAAAVGAAKKPCC
ncbi:hypothetical protein EG328_012052 [Venturia inaequalis]|uniref:Uncharacterized protein n=1 Tax=Venturia inaequalis TaxID=5025 RepID=A0A8H3U497_VENIN|nr:hypothetical protein EG328_012052 [Venturia inaequalis]